MIYECTDCQSCANFEDGYRIFCMHADLPPDRVCDYQPLGNKDAQFCEGFSGDYFALQEFNGAELEAALATPDDEGQINSYGGCRKWVEALPRPRPSMTEAAQ